MPYSSSNGYPSAQRYTTQAAQRDAESTENAVLIHPAYANNHANNHPEEYHYTSPPTTISIAETSMREGHSFNPPSQINPRLGEYTELGTPFPTRLRLASVPNEASILNSSQTRPCIPMKKQPLYEQAARFLNGFFRDMDINYAITGGYFFVANKVDVLLGHEVSQMEIFIFNTNFEYAQKCILNAIRYFAEKKDVYPALRGTLSSGLEDLRYESSQSHENVVNIRILSSDNLIPLDQFGTVYIEGIKAYTLDLFTFFVSCARRWDALQRDIGYYGQRHTQDQNRRSVADLRKEAEILLDYVMVTWKKCSGRFNGYHYKYEDMKIVGKMNSCTDWSYESNRYATNIANY